MRTLINILLVLLLAVMVENCFGKNNLNTEIEVSYLSRYIWRGQEGTDDPVIQPSLTTTYENLKLNIWGNIDTTGTNNNEGDFSELDYTVEYWDKFPGINRINYSLGMIYYDFPCTNFEDTTELFWGIDIDIPLKPFIRIYHDLDEVKGGIYKSIGLGHSINNIFKIGRETRAGIQQNYWSADLNLNASLGWGNKTYNRSYWEVKKQGLNDFVFSIALPIENRGITLIPNITFINLIDSKIRNTRNGNDFTVFGITICKKF